MSDFYKGRKIVKRETIFDNDRWSIPACRDTYRVRVWREGSFTKAAFFFHNYAHGHDTLIRKWFEGLVADEIKHRILTKRIRLIYRPMKERVKGCPMTLLWFEGEV